MYLQVLCLVLYVVFMRLCFVFGVICSFHETVIVLVAMAITAVVCLSVTIFAIQTKVEFSVPSRHLNI